MKQAIRLGIENLLDNNNLKNQRIGLLCNQASVNHRFEHAADLFAGAFGDNLTTLFGPQHGIRGDVQDNMVETGHSIDPATGRRVFSLYSETREPTAEMLADIDVLVCDLFDVGCRVYTFIYTIANCLRAAQKFDKKVVVCDRPNPINGVSIEGNLLDPAHASFVGQFPIPMRHGLTVGETTLLFQRRFGLECDLEIVPMTGWQREMWFDQIDAPWVMPSPNMPTLATATVFPGTVLLEGTQLSEGRGTTRPFEIIGAPYLKAVEFARELNAFNLPGVVFRACDFVPTFQKHRGAACGGVQLHVTNRDSFKPFLTGVAAVKAAHDLAADEFDWKQPPYEYVFDRNPFDVINGGEAIRKLIEAHATLEEVEQSYSNQTLEFSELKQAAHLY